MKLCLIISLLFICNNCLFAQQNKTSIAKINGISYQATLINNSRSLIIKAGDKVIIHLDSAGVWDFKFVDFDRDGYKDLLIEYVSNTPGDNNLFLYSKQKRNFMTVKNFVSFSSAKILGNNNLYYSYERAGCSDLKWDSSLFKIVNFKAIELGRISGLGCKGDEEIGIFISKINGEKERLIKKYPIGEIEKYKSYKWGFIKQYWNRNYRKFL